MKQKLVDRAIFLVTAGRGGHGSIHFRREKHVPKGGPDGGDGGRGGSIVMRANRHLATLRYFSGKDRFEAEKGRPGGKRQRGGEDAEDKVIEVPVGTVVMINREEHRLLKGRKLYGEDVERMVSSGYKVDRVEYLDFEERWFGSEKGKEILRQSGFSHKSRLAQDDTVDVESVSAVSSEEREWVEVVDLDEDGKELVVACGGRGGLGNTTYKSSRNTTPKVAQRGELGEKFTVRLELKVLADIGLVGLPNAGKSTLLSVITAARPEIADYPFTTITPNLGVMEIGFLGYRGQTVIADIPGLIEDAHKGKGLGMDFLRHVERCRVLLYIIAPTEEMLVKLKAQNSNVKTKFQKSDLGSMLWEQYETVRKEVESYGQALEKKPYLVVVNKLDLIQEARSKVQNYFKKKGIEVVLISAATTEGVGELKKRMVELVIQTG